MKQWKRTIAALTACTMLSGGAMAYLPEFPVNTDIMVHAAEDFTTGTYEELTYANYGDHIEITGCDKSAKVLVIPPEIEGLPVTKIGDSAFYRNKTLTSIIVSETVTTIGNLVFAGADALTEVVLHEGLVEVGTNAFEGTPITEIYIPSTLQSCYHIFDECSTLTDVTFGEGITKLPDYLFYNADGLTKINVPETVTTIGNFVFAKSDALKDAYLPASLTEIGCGVFDDCSVLTDIWYAGSEEAWNNIQIGKPNTGLDNAVIHYGASTPAPAAPLMGDLDNSGDINASDAAALLTAAAAAGTGGVSGLTPEQEKAADLNKDGTFDAKDGALVLQYAAYVGTGGTQPIDEFLAERAAE